MDSDLVLKIRGVCMVAGISISGQYEADGRVVKIIGFLTNGDVSRATYDAFIAAIQGFAVPG